jgi:hypothetical protein
MTGKLLRALRFRPRRLALTLFALFVAAALARRKAKIEIARLERVLVLAQRRIIRGHWYS